MLFSKENENIYIVDFWVHSPIIRGDLFFNFIAMQLILIVVIIIAIVAVVYYNSFISKKNHIENSRSDINVQLKRRYDLIPNLVETVKWYKDFESDTLTKLTEARAKTTASTSVQDKAKTEKELGWFLTKFFAVAENYPDLKSNQSFLDLQNQLSGIEDALQNARRYYNATVRDYNTMCESFPGNQVAKRFNFTKKEFFQVDEAEKGNVQVKF